MMLQFWGKALRAEPNTGVYTGLDVNGPRVDYHVYSHSQVLILFMYAVRD